ncbi:MAG: hypothetical protein ABMA13_20100 [Chthoniobacteraceae bacterium]
MKHVRSLLSFAMIAMAVLAFFTPADCTALDVLTAFPLLGALAPSASLTLDKIMREALRALKRRLSPVLALSHVMRDQVLTETDTIQVPFYSLETMASRDFDGSYSFEDADGAVGTKPVVIDKRKYQALEFTSKELRRNSVIDLNQVMALKVEKLAEDVLDDIFSIATVANFGAAIFTGAASTFDRDDAVDIGTTVSQAHWPSAGRSLILESAYIGALVKDLNAPDTAVGDEVRREGMVARTGGWDLFEHPNMPTVAINRVGMACLPYALLTAFSPIEPSDEVRDNMSDYRIYTDPTTGLSLEYRSWGDPNSDKARRVVEVNYGKGLGDTAQGEILVSA